MEKEQNQNFFSKHKKLAKILGITGISAAAAGGIGVAAHNMEAPEPTVQSVESPHISESAAPVESPEPISPSAIETEGTVSVPVETETAAPEETSTPEETPAPAETEAAEKPNFSIQVGEGDSIEGIAYSYYPDLNETKVVDAIEAVNPDKDLTELYKQGSIVIPGEIDGTPAQDLGE